MAITEAHDVTIEQDVVFATTDARELLCDVYRPPAAHTKETAILHLHGGGFRVGSKAGTRLARPLAARGYTCVSSSYRLLNEATWPAQLDDVYAGIDWVREHAGELGVNPSKVVVLGYSAGARLALIAAGLHDDPHRPTGVAAAVAFYAPAGGGAHAVLGGNPSEELVRTFSPLRHVQRGYPPTMLLHGTADQTVPVEDSLKVYTALREVGAPVELHVLDGVTHIFDIHEDLALACAEWIDLFVDRHVVNPRVYASTEPNR
jgi:acetyl esterase/lipase